MKRKFVLLSVLFAVSMCTYSCKHEPSSEKQAEQGKKEKTVAQKALDKKAKDSYALILKWGDEYFHNPKLGKNGKSCSVCHEGGKGLNGKAVTYPKYVAKLGKVVQLPHMVNYCYMNALRGKKDMSFDSTKMISILTYISSLKGEAVAAVQSDAVAKAALEKAVKEGDAYFHDDKAGTNGRTCADCHENGKKLHGKAAQFPKYLTMADRVVLLGHMVNYCGYGPLKSKKDVLLATDKMTSIVAYIATFE